MKIVVFGPDKRTGALRDGLVVDLSYAFAKYLHERAAETHPVEMASLLVPAALGRFIEGGPRALENAEKAVDYLFTKAADRLGPREEKLVYQPGEARLHAPKPVGARVACAGSNFADHAAAMAARFESQSEVRSASQDQIRSAARRRGIWGFWRIEPDAVGPDGEVIYPAGTHRLDYEGEAAIILGKRGKDIAASKADAFIWGVTLFVDWSIRDLAEPEGFYRFAMSKNFDTGHSIGPCIAVGEVAPAAVEVETLVNGERRQHYNTRDMIFPFDELIEYLSRDLTLRPGDIISGGTAAGTAADSSPLLPDRTFAPERFLKPGDTVEIRSPAIGSLRARIVPKPVAR